MKTIRWGFRDLKFQDDDPDFHCFNQLVELKNNKELEKEDFEIIISMFKLHNSLPSLPEILFSKGFTLPKNDHTRGNVNATWEHGIEGGRKKIIKYGLRMWDTMFNRSDHYHINIDFLIDEQLTAIYRYRNCEDDYGRIKTHEKQCSVKKGDEVIIEHIKSFE